MVDTYLWKVTVKLESVNTGEVLARSIKGELPHLAEDIGDSVLVKDVLEEARRAYHTGKTDPAQRPLQLDGNDASRGGATPDHENK